MLHCHVVEPAGDPAGSGSAIFGYGIRLDEIGGNLRVEFCDFRCNSESGVTPSSRTMISIWVAPGTNDGKIVGNRSMYARTAFRGNVGSFTFVANHFWQGSTGTGPFSDYTENFLLGGRSHNIIVGNYIDNGRTVLQEGLDMGSEFSDEYMGYGQWIGNIFTVADNDQNYSFFMVKPKGANRKVLNLIIMGNQFRSLGTVNETIRKPFAVDTSLGGSIDLSFSQDNKIINNYWRTKVIPQETEIERHINRPGGGTTSFGVDLTGFTPFGLYCRHVKSCGIMYNGADPGTDTATYRFHRNDANYGGTLRVVPAAAGSAVLTLTCNSTSIFDTPIGSF